jgi:plasmid stabilization system protein ParE
VTEPRPLVFEPAAADEAAEARDWYAERSHALRERFLADLRAALLAIHDAPERWPQIAPGLRRMLLRRFPYAVLYVVEADQIHVVAVMHQRRRPGYWQKRH